MVVVPPLVGRMKGGVSARGGRCATSARESVAVGHERRLMRSTGGSGRQHSMSLASYSSGSGTSVMGQRRAWNGRKFLQLRSARCDCANVSKTNLLQKAKRTTRWANFGPLSEEGGRGSRVARPSPSSSASPYLLEKSKRRTRSLLTKATEPPAGESDLDSSIDTELQPFSSTGSIEELYEPGDRPAFVDLAIRVGAALAFGAYIDLQFGFDKAEAYFTGYILEQTLSVDNLFVFILLFDYFNVPSKGKDRVLNFGIYTAAVLRGILIVLGSELVEKFEPVLLVFAGILLYSAYGILFAGGGEEEAEDINDSAIVKFCKRFIDVSDDYDGDKFFTVENGVKVATPLLLVLATVELSDLVFAVDSIPAVFGVTKDPFIVYSSNMFAILCLRSLFSVVSSAMEELKYLEQAVGIVLGFVGFKMVADFGGIHISNDQSLIVVCAIVGGGVALSLMAGNEDDEENSASK